MQTPHKRGEHKTSVSGHAIERAFDRLVNQPAILVSNNKGNNRSASAFAARQQSVSASGAPSQCGLSSCFAYMERPRRAVYSARLSIGSSHVKRSRSFLYKFNAFPGCEKFALRRPAFGIFNNRRPTYRSVQIFCKKEEHCNPPDAFLVPLSPFNRTQATRNILLRNIRA
jgi:hypothetical protein